MTAVEVAFPLDLLWQALGRPTDKYAVAAAGVQSMFFTPVASGLLTYQLADPKGHSAQETAAARPSRRRSPRGLVAVVALAVTATIGGVTWFLGGMGGQERPALSSAASSARPSKTPRPQPSRSPAQKATPSPEPTRTPSGTPVRPSSKPNVTLKSDLAFDFDSAELSGAARAAIARVARQVQDAGLRGDIFVDGYTDNLGSAAYGKHLSQRRADAVARVLGKLLRGQPLRVIAVGHGESDPIASNATEAGRRTNRRVTITLPEP